MDISPSILFSQIFYWDITLVVSMAMLCMVGISIWLLRNRFGLLYLAVSWGLFLLLLGIGFSLARRAEDLCHVTWLRALEGVTQSLASATESMGHAKISRETELDSPLYQGILKLQAAWLHDFPVIEGVTTLRLRENESAKVYRIVESQWNRDVQIDSLDLGPTFYSPSEEWLGVYRKSFDGKLALLDTSSPTSDDPAVWHDDHVVVVTAPLHDPDHPQYIEAILRVDFDLDQWFAILGRVRFASAQLLALCLGLYLTALTLIALLHRNMLRMAEARHELIAAQKVADAAARAKSDFLANMSHEIRTPMSALVGFTEILAQRVYQSINPDDREELEGIMEIIRENGRLLLTVINDILDFSKIEANLLQIESVPVSIKRVIQEIWHMEMPKVVEKHLDFSVTYTEPIPDIILADPTRLRQILINLVANAVKFTEKGSITIHCETYEPPKQVMSADSQVAVKSGVLSGIRSHILSSIRPDMRSRVGSAVVPHSSESAEISPVSASETKMYPSTMLKIDVIDTGIGIDRKQLDHLFQPFTQLDNSSTRRFGGIGLGLSISKRLAEMMDGDITVKSEQGGGSVFTLTLLAYLPSPQEMSDSSPEIVLKPLGSQIVPGLEIRSPLPQEAAEEPKGADTEAKPLQNVRILLVEDMVVNQLVISTQLRDAGASVEIAGNGEQGIQKIVENMDNGLFFDVVLMDMQMPVMDGYEATSTLRQQGYTRPIVAVTAHALTGDREKTIEAGCDDYLAKPVDRKKLVLMIQKYL